jgi:glycosyltransferase involved in cell wall biosynthesis
MSMGRLAEYFIEQGHAVDIVMRRPPGEPAAFAHLAGAAELLFVDRPQKVWLFFELLRIVRRRHPDVVLAFDTRANQIASWLMLVPGMRARVWMSLRNLLAQKHGRMLRAACARCAGVIAISQGLADHFLGLTGADPGKVHVIHNPAVPPGLADLAAERLDDPWLKPDQPPVIVAVGRLTEQKDFPTLIRAFAALRATRPCRLMILGQGELLETLKALCGVLGVADDVRFCGFQANPWNYMRGASVFVLSSAWEGFGNVLAEALSLGVPVVSTDCPYGPREILQGGRLGRLVPVGEPAKLAEAMASTLDHPPAPGPLMAGALRFTRDVSGAQYLRLLLAKDPE